MSYKILKGVKYYPCSNNSILIQEFDIQTLSEFLNTKITKEEIKILESKQNIEKINQEKIVLKSKTLDEYFIKNITKKDRNLAIIKSYKNGYT